MRSTINWKYFDLMVAVQVTLGVLPLAMAGDAPVGAAAPLPACGGFDLALLVLKLVVAASVRFRGPRRRKPSFVNDLRECA